MANVPARPCAPALLTMPPQTMPNQRSPAGQKFVSQTAIYWDRMPCSCPEDTESEGLATQPLMKCNVIPVNDGTVVTDRDTLVSWDLQHMVNTHVHGPCRCSPPISRARPNGGTPCSSIHCLTQAWSVAIQMAASYTSPHTGSSSLLVPRLMLRK
jgi:hypothetical protein